MSKKQRIITAAVLLFILTIVMSACGTGVKNAKNDSASAKKIDYPTKPITLIVPFAAGGGTDAVARSIAAAAKKQLGGASIVVDNKTGGSGAVGITEGVNAAPNGYTLTMVTEGMVVLPHLGVVSFTKNDLKPVALINFDPSAVTVRADSPFNTLQDFLDEAKKNPGKLRVGTSATNTIWDLGLSSLEKETGLKFTHVPYEAGAAPAIKDVLGGHIEAITVSPAEVVSLVQAGKLKTLAIMSNKRSDVMKDVPTFKELGIQLDVGAWRGIAAPKNTPDGIVKILSDAFTKAASDEEFTSFMNKNGFGIQVKNSEEFVKHINDSSDYFGKLLTDLGVKK